MHHISFIHPHSPVPKQNGIKVILLSHHFTVQAKDQGGVREPGGQAAVTHGRASRDWLARGLYRRARSLLYSSTQARTSCAAPHRRARAVQLHTGAHELCSSTQARTSCAAQCVCACGGEWRQVVMQSGSVDGQLAAYIVSYVIVTNWVILQVITDWAIIVLGHH